MFDDQQLADALFPGFGFFGPTDYTALRVPVSGLVDRVVIGIGAPGREILNLAGVGFTGTKGRKLDNAEIVASAELSTIFGKTTPDEVLERVRRGGLLHSTREPSPTLTITLSEPMPIGEIVIRNRPGAFGARSRFLEVCALHAGETVASCHNDTPAMRQAALAQLTSTLAARDLLPALATECSVEEAATAYRSAIIALIESGRADWPPLYLASLLDLSPPASAPIATPRLPNRAPDLPGRLWGIAAAALRLRSAKPARPRQKASAGQTTAILPARREPTDYEITVSAELLRAFRNISKSFPTNALAFLAPILNRPAHVAAVVEKANRLINAGEKRPTVTVLSKHMLHEAKLHARKEAFLDAMGAFFRICPDLGIRACICYGTLLGAVRENQFLLHDDDVDILVVSDAKTEAEAWQNRDTLFARLASMGYRVSGDRSNFTLIIEQAGLDLFLCWENDSRLHLMMERYEFRSVPAEIMLPLGEVSLYGKTFPAPARPEAFLEERYGKGWTVSDPYHEWPWPLE